LSSDLLAENILTTFEDAHARLLRPGAAIIPRAATRSVAWWRAKFFPNPPCRRGVGL